MEEWRDIVGLENYYQVSNFGRIRGLERTVMNQNGVFKTTLEKIRKLGTDARGYKQVTLNCKKGKRATKVHILVAEAFIPKVIGKTKVNHIDGNKENNHYSNLEWCTNAENSKHAWENGLYNSVKRTVLQYSQQKVFLKKWDSTMEIQRNLGIWNTQISKCCSNEFGKYTAGGYYWRYE